jgi:hypothetical protein
VFFGDFPVLPFDIRQEDAILQLDVIGNQLSLRAWRPGEPMPAQPQLTAQDDAYQSGWVAIIGGSEGTTTFRYVGVADASIANPPVLDIEKCSTADEVVLSWPPASEPFHVLAASSVDGPWIPGSTPVVLVGGRNQVAFAVDTAARFFQLRSAQPLPMTE